jgi:hypothetical protein
LYYLEKNNFIIVENREPKLEVKAYSYYEREKILEEKYIKYKDLEDN